MQAVEQGKDPVDSPLLPLSRLMGMETKQSNLLLAFGLSEKYGKETRVSRQGWEDLRSLFQLDIDLVERKKSKHIAPGKSVWVVRVRSFTNGKTCKFSLAYIPLQVIS